MTYIIVARTAYVLVFSISIRLICLGPSFHGKPGSSIKCDCTIRDPASLTIH